MEQPQKGKDLQNPNRRIQFNLTSRDLECFISKQPKSKSSNKRQPKTNHYTKPYIKVIQQYMPHKVQNSPYFDFCFDHKVVFTKYGPFEVYVDEQPKTHDSDNFSNQNQQNFQTEEVVSQCVRAITEDSSDGSSVDYLSVQMQAYKYYNQQIDMSRSRNRSNGQDVLYCIRPNEVQIDGRTTLMLRNIPNKYTQEMILQEVQSAGLEFKYDFFYLPIDFKNDCNVGYAFINLIDLPFVQKLYEKFHGKKWPRFNSEKICQVCYARIQGTPQLLNHFRFSNTLQRDNRYRPLIYVNLGLNQNKNKEAGMKNNNEKQYASFTI